MPQKEWMSEFSRNRANPKPKGRLTIYLGYAAGTGKRSGCWKMRKS